MRTGLTISVIGHALVLAWGLLTFAAKPLEATPGESLPVDIISDTEFSQIMAGQRNAKQAPKPKPLVEKIAEAKPVEDPVGKITEKKEIPPTAKTDAPPLPEPKPAEPEQKPQPKEQAKAEPKPAEKPKAEPKVDPIAEALKKEEAKKPLKKPVKERRFDPALTQALLDKRKPERHAAAGDVLNSSPTLGLASGRAATLSQSDLDMIAAQYRQCWSVPVGVENARELSVVVRILLRQDGTLAAEPVVTNRSSHPMFQIAAESALRAVRRCQPLRTPPIAKYETWKDIEVNFDPRDMFRS